MIKEIKREGHSVELESSLSDITSDCETYNVDAVLIVVRDVPPLLAWLEGEFKVRHANVPVVALLPWFSPATTIALLDAGADSVVRLPFYTPELLARLRALQRRTPERPRGRVLQAGPWTLDPAALTIKHESETEPRRCRPRDFSVLWALGEAYPSPVKPNLLHGEIFDYASNISPEAITTAVYGVRQRVGFDTIANRRGSGYTLGTPTSNEEINA